MPFLGISYTSEIRFANLSPEYLVSVCGASESGKCCYVVHTSDFCGRHLYTVSLRAFLSVSMQSRDGVQWEQLTEAQIKKYLTLPFYDFSLADPKPVVYNMKACVLCDATVYDFKFDGHMKTHPKAEVDAHVKISEAIASDIACTFGRETDESNKKTLDSLYWNITKEIQFLKTVHKTA